MMKEKKKAVNTGIIAVTLLTVLVITVVLTKYVSYRKYREEKDSFEALTESTISGIDCIINGKKAVIDAYNEKFAECLFLLEDDPGDAFYISDMDAEDWDLSVLSRSTGQDIKRFGLNIYSLSEIEFILSELSECLPETKCVYLYVDPVRLRSYHERYESDTSFDRLFQDSIVKYARTNPNTEIRILFPIKDISYWTGLSSGEFDAEMVEWDYWINKTYGEDNIKIYCLGCEEWLLCNTDLYKENGNLIEDMTKHVSLVTFCDGEYRMGPVNVPFFTDKIENTIEKYTSGAYIYKSLADRKLIFLGDSVLANNSYPEYSISSVVSFLTGADCYNLAIGGTTAAGDGNFQTFYGMSDLLKNNVIPEGGPYQNSEELKRFYDGLSETDDLTFIINYGLNDYFTGVPMESSDGNVNCFEDALRAGIRNLKTRFPNASILIMTPYYIGYLEGGTGPFVEGGSILPEYVDAEIRVAKEEGVSYLNLYEDSGIGPENVFYYVRDEVHPSEAGSFLIGEILAQKLTETP